MTRLLAGAMALALLAGSAAVADPYDNHNGDRGQDSMGHDRMGHDDRGGDRGDRGRGHIVCSWRHHHRVCYRQHW